MTTNIVKKRNRIIPQMVDYDQLGEQWLPYVMRAEGASRSFPSVNTDRWGLRYSICHNGDLVTLDSRAEKVNKAPVGVVIGSSAVFGVGSTLDRNTIPSYLTQKTDTTWFNLGGRAYNSTQELIRLSLHLPKKLDHILVFSGVNNITLSFLSSYTSPVYNSFFYQSVFAQAMSNPMGEEIGVRQAWSRLVRAVGRRFQRSNDRFVREQIVDHYTDVSECFERDLRVLKAIAEGVGAKIYFALQPFVVWLDKKLTPEEDEIFSILGSEPGVWNVLATRILDVKERYFTDIARTCDELSIPHFNLNLSPEFNAQEWLFVDRVHLTDRGCQLSAEILKREFKL